MATRLSIQEYLGIRRNILKKLYQNGRFSKGHMLFENLRSGISPHLGGFVKPILKELIKEGLVKVYGKTKYGTAYQLNYEIPLVCNNWLSARMCL